MDTPMWDMYQNSTSDISEIAPTSASDNFSWSFTDTLNNVTNSADSWLDSVGGTVLKFTEMNQQYKNIKNGGSAAKEETERSFERATQEEALSSPIPNISKNTLIYGGVALVAAYLIFGGD